MLICLNCTSEQSDPYATVCEVCRMPGMLEQKSGRPTVPSNPMQPARTARCFNCGEDLADAAAIQCPHCRVQLMQQQKMERKPIMEPETRHAADRAHFSVATGSEKRI